MKKLIKIKYAFTLMASFLAAAAQAASFLIPDVANEYTIKVIAECNSEQCEGPAEIHITKKNGGLVQTLKTPDLAVYLNANKKLPANHTVLYSDQSAVVADDFNFDGTTDIAIRNGNNSAYGGPSYDVYVYNISKRKFVLSDELTELATSKLGMFSVDKARKRLITFEKSGCCWHQTTHYAVSPGRGLYVVYSLVEAATSDGKNVEVTTSSLVGKKMKSSTKLYPVDSYYK
ncbi:FG-GAP repeat protein [Iodobacter sp. LRB]|uniref:FG-GAP repeat protein n=1 Tax=unclassified Iodobacter TaxID=235634 RepID=UPI000C113FF9|nr:FG-GAP repeat protein [Iodobacter sp. BJB302]PHV00267.1 hypothetical protein CSQ88_18195 [Iodobacter sp. BJB302]